MVEIELSGSPRQIGLSRGKQLRYAIQMALEHHGFGHAHQWTLEAAHAYGRRMAEDLNHRCPALLEEVIATAKGAQLPEADMLAYNFRVWNALSGHRATLACYGMSGIDPKRGMIIAGTLDDSPQFYLLEILRPRSGQACYVVNWAGMAWAGKAMNKAGLAIGQASSFAGTRFRPGKHKFPFDCYSRSFFAQRWAIQNATTVAEAIEILRSFECAGVFILSDRSGKVAALECCGDLSAVREPDADGIVTAGTFESPELIKSLIDDGVAHDWEEGVRLAMRTSAALRKVKGKFSMEWMAKFLQTERTDGGWCHTDCQAAFIASSKTGEFWVSGCRPCTSGFKIFNVKAL